MDRRNFYYRQRVTEAELDSAFDDAEIGIWNLVKDIGLLGVVTGAEVIENAPTNLTVDVLGPAAIYDQAGQRIYFGVTQDLDCALDYLGNPTVPTVVGEKVWISIHARFARNLQDLRTDGNGDPVYWIRGEYFELRVVAGTPAGGGGHTRPSKPTDAILLADIELSEGQTSIVDANISTTRRDDFQWTLGANIGVDDSAWANIGPAADVQDAFDNVDDVVLDRDGTGDITEDIIPAALGQFLGESGSAWDAYLRNVTLSGPLTAASDGIDIGDATNRFDMHMGVGVCYATLRPDATGRGLGDATRRWDAYLEDSLVYGTLALSSANSTTLIFDSSNISLAGTFVQSTAFVTGTDDSEVVLPLKGIPDGAEITQIEVRWRQSAAGGGQANFLFHKRAFATASRTQVGSTIAISGYGADETSVLSGLTETLDLAANEYVVVLQGGIATADTRIYQVRVSYNYTNLLAAIQAC